MNYKAEIRLGRNQAAIEVGTVNEKGDLKFGRTATVHLYNEAPDDNKVLVSQGSIGSAIIEVQQERFDVLGQALRIAEQYRHSEAPATALKQTLQRSLHKKLVGIPVEVL